MKIYSSLSQWNQEPLENPVLTLGVFDGVHLGHQDLIRQQKEWSSQVGGQALILTFTRHPQSVLQKNLAFPLIQTIEHRLRIFEELAVEGVLLLPFDQELALMTPEEFFRKIICQELQCHYFLLGYDSRFGYQGRGDFPLALNLGKANGVEVRQGKVFLWEGKPLSSSMIRNSIQKGQLQGAGRMLGRPYSFLAKIIKGQGMGRKLGFPTANLDLQSILVPPYGVYMVEVAILPHWQSPIKKSYSALMNIGVRPTINGGKRQVEVHIPHFEGDIYGQYLHVVVGPKIRDEKKFQSLEELEDQIQKDCQLLEELLKEGKPF